MDRSRRLASLPKVVRSPISPDDCRHAEQLVASVGDRSDCRASDKDVCRTARMARRRCRDQSWTDRVIALILLAAGVALAFNIPSSKASFTQPVQPIRLRWPLSRYLGPKLLNPASALTSLGQGSFSDFAGCFRPAIGRRQRASLGRLSGLTEYGLPNRRRRHEPTRCRRGRYLSPHHSDPASAPGRVGGVELQSPVPHLPWSHPASAATTGANSRTAIPKCVTDELLKSTLLVSCACKSARHADLIGTDDVSRTMNVTLRRHRPKCAPGGRGISLRIRQGWHLRVTPGEPTGII